MQNVAEKKPIKIDYPNAMIYKMEQLVDKLSHLNISDLEQDVNVILTAYYRQLPTLDKNNLCIQKHAYGSAKNLYRLIIRILQTKNQFENLLDMMPLIDEYLDYYMCL